MFDVFIAAEDEGLMGCGMALFDAEDVATVAPYLLLCDGGGARVVFIGDIVVVALRWVIP